MRDDEFFLPRHEREHLAELLTTTIPALVEDLAVTASKQDRLNRRELSQIRHVKRPGSQMPVNLGATEAGNELHAALVGAVRLMCETRGVHYDGDPTTLGLCGWLQRNVTAIALTEGAEDLYFEIAGATKAARRAIDHPPVIVHYVGTCRACDADMYARREETVYPCQCGTVTTKLAQDARIVAELEWRNYTAIELVAIVRDRFGMTVKPKAIYDLEYRKLNPVESRGFKVLPSGKRAKVYNAGEVFAALRARTGKAGAA